MAEQSIHERETPMMRPAPVKGPQGSVSAEGTIAVFEPGSKVLLVSRSHRQSMELFRIITDFFHRMEKPMLKRQTTEELELVVDPSLLENDEMYFNAARLDRSMVLKTRDYIAVAKPRLGHIAKGR